MSEWTVSEWSVSEMSANNLNLSTPLSIAALLIVILIVGCIFTLHRRAAAKVKTEFSASKLRIEELENSIRKSDLHDRLVMCMRRRLAIYTRVNYETEQDQIVTLLTETHEARMARLVNTHAVQVARLVATHGEEVRYLNGLNTLLTTESDERANDFAGMEGVYTLRITSLETERDEIATRLADREAGASSS